MSPLDKNLAALQATIRDAVTARSKLRIRGFGSKSFVTTPLPENARLLDTRSLSGIVSYDPRELVITAKCGTPLAEIEQALAENGQMLPFEPPHFGAQASIGGVVASGLSGPRRAYAGSVRDNLLGTRLLNAAGEELEFGGQVMKNVAGYDLSRLLSGSNGSLGLITQVSIKVMPRPQHEASLQIELDQAGALNRLREIAGKPWPISASAWYQGQLHLRLSGSCSAVAAAKTKLGGEPVENADRFWQSLRDHHHAFFTKDNHYWRIALPKAAGALFDETPCLIEWNGQQRWLRVPDETADELIGKCRKLGGHARLFRSASPEPAHQQTRKILRKIKQSIDSEGLFI